MSGISITNMTASTVARLATLLAPALALSASIPRSNPGSSAIYWSGPIPWSDPIPRSDPILRSGPGGLAVTCGADWGTTLTVAKLRIASQFVNATVTRIRRHHPPVSALRRNFTLFALGHCETCKTAHGTEYRNGEEYLDHVPSPSRATQRKGRDPPMN
jgi:hypothetical protein